MASGLWANPAADATRCLGEVPSPRAALPQRGTSCSRGADFLRLQEQRVVWPRRFPTICVWTWGVLPELETRLEFKTPKPTNRSVFGEIVLFMSVTEKPPAAAAFLLSPRLSPALSVFSLKELGTWALVAF